MFGPVLICLEQEPVKVIFILFYSVLLWDTSLIIHIYDGSLTVLHAPIRNYAP
jgi:hypothetical protein